MYYGRRRADALSDVELLNDDKEKFFEAVRSSQGYEYSDPEKNKHSYL